MALSSAQEAIYPATEPKLVSWKVVVAGLLLIIASDYYINWSTVILRASKNNKALFPMGLFFPFVVLVGVNLLLSRINLRWALNRGQLCVALGMGLIGSLFPFYGLASYVVGTIAAPYYFATPENGWAELLHPNMVSWLVMNNEDQAVTWFYDGLPPGQAIPWSAWAVPVFWWMTFVAAAACVALCLMVILRKQWVENERLEFPLMVVGMQVAQVDKGDTETPSLLSQPLFRMGFWIGIFAVFWNIISYFYPLIPGLPTTHTEGQWFRWLEGAKPFWVQISIYVIGFAYFARVETLFSFWLFFLFTEIEVATFDRLGFAAGHGGGEAVRSQNFGVLCAYVMFGLWMARGHLKAVFRKVFKGASDVDDFREVMSYRAAVIALVASLLYMVAWLHAAGMEVRVVLLYLFFHRSSLHRNGPIRCRTGTALWGYCLPFNYLDTAPHHGRANSNSIHIDMPGLSLGHVRKNPGISGTSNRANVKTDHPIARRSGAFVRRDRPRRSSRRHICNTPCDIHGLFLRRLQPQSRVESADRASALLRCIRNLDPQPRGTRCGANVIHGVWRIDHSRTHLFEIPLRTPAPPSRSPDATGHLYGAENSIFSISDLDLQINHTKNRRGAPLQKRTTVFHRPADRICHSDIFILRDRQHLLLWTGASGTRILKGDISWQQLIPEHMA